MGWHDRGGFCPGSRFHTHTGTCLGQEVTIYVGPWTLGQPPRCPFQTLLVLRWPWLVKCPLPLKDRLVSGDSCSSGVQVLMCPAALRGFYLWGWRRGQTVSGGGRSPGAFLHSVLKGRESGSLECRQSTKCGGYIEPKPHPRGLCLIPES